MARVASSVGKSGAPGAAVLPVGPAPRTIAPGVGGERQVLPCYPLVRPTRALNSMLGNASKSHRMLQRVCQTQGGPETWMFRRLPTDVKQGILTIISISIQDNVDYIILNIRLLLYLSFITLDITTVSVISMLPRSSNVCVNMFATFGLYCLIFIQRVALHWI
jgi:hypothetical protein